ncbi:hypothetical protein ACIODW_26245 [Streptomyces sp. NPDC087897]|uniref:hypothetical protein n=1 Tax=Streptomyces sp. NPDC087897 TaxID=3365817 RepID=UPI0037FA9F5D
MDREGTRSPVGAGSAYDLFLTREIRRAEVVQLEGAPRALAAPRTGQVDVAAGIRPSLKAEAARAEGVRVLQGRFMVIRQAMGLPAGRGAAALECSPRSWRR